MNKNNSVRNITILKPVLTLRILCFISTDIHLFPYSCIQTYPSLSISVKLEENPVEW